MRQTRRPMLWLAAAAVATLAASGMAAAQTYPIRPVRIVLALPPGGAPEIIARVFGGKFTAQTGQQVIVDTRPGASGVIAAEIVKAAPPDGYTLLLAGTTVFATLPEFKAGLPYDPNRDYALLSRVASVAHVVAVHPSLGVGSIADFVKLAQARPGQLNYGSSGNGSSSHLAGEMFNVLAGVKTIHVPYKGTVLALNEVISGQLQFVLMNPLVVMPHARTGRVKVIATTGARRDPLLPDLPAVAEAVPGFESTLWWGIAVPVKTPPAIVKMLHAGIVKVLRSPELLETLARQGALAHVESPAEFAAFIKAERERIAIVGRKVGITFD